MAINTSDTTSGFGDVIANNIPSRAFRYSAENKNVLSKKGSIYVGTGNTRKTKMLLDYAPYNAGATYQEGDYVEYRGSDYRCKQASTGNAPTDGSDNDYWALDTITYESAVTAALNPPTSNGTYTLKCIIANGIPTLRWVEDN